MQLAATKATIDDMTSAHQQQLDRLTSANHKAIDDLTSAHQQDVNDMTSTHQQQVDDRTSAHSSQIEEMESDVALLEARIATKLDRLQQLSDVQTSSITGSKLLQVADTAAIRRPVQNPTWKETQHAVCQKLGDTPQFPPFHRALTLAPSKHGREMIIEQLQAIENPVLLELGVFLGGSSAYWFEQLANVSVVAVDQFPNYWGYLNIWTKQPDGAEFRKYLPQLKHDAGTFETVVSNLWQHRHNLCLVKGDSTAGLAKLAGLEPDVIFVDTDKTMDEVWVAHTLWPDAMITGDDWGHQNTMKQTNALGKTFTNVVDASTNVCRFAKKYRMKVRVRGWSWYLHTQDGFEDACPKVEPCGANGMTLDCKTK